MSGYPDHLKNKKVTVKHLGLIDYKAAWDFQEKVFKEILDHKIRNRDLPEDENTGTANYLFTCEHPHVYTLGKSGKREHLLVDEIMLKEKQATYYEINRGGDITYHGPGQLVVYPVLDLENFFTDIHKYLRLLEEAVIDTIGHYGIYGDRIEGLTGVWIGKGTSNPRKICAMGVRSSRWVTMHGLALNVNTDLLYFNNIIPCGIEDKAVTSMKAETGRVFPLIEVQEILVENILKLFGMSRF